MKRLINQITKVLIRLRGCAAGLRLYCSQTPEDRFSDNEAQFYNEGLIHISPASLLLVKGKHHLPSISAACFQNVLKLKFEYNVSKGAKIKNRYNQVPHLTQETNGKVTNSQQTPQTRAKRSALSQQVTTKHI